MIHAAESPYKCDISNKSFKIKECLNKYILRHTGETLYSVTPVTSLFFSKGEHNKHFMMRTEETPYKCDIFDKCFQLKQYLNEQ